jgi:hypothetical protein
MHANATDETQGLAGIAQYRPCVQYPAGGLNMLAFIQYIHMYYIDLFTDDGTLTSVIRQADNADTPGKMGTKSPRQSINHRQCLLEPLCR